MNDLLFEEPVQKQAIKPVRKRPRKTFTKQEKLYFFLWKQIFSKFKVPFREQSSWRKDLRMQILGSVRNQKTFNNTDYDLIIPALREMLSQASLLVYPAKMLDLYSQGVTRRYAHLINEIVKENKNISPNYVSKIAQNKFAVSSWQQDLNAKQTQELFYTISNRSKRK